MQYERDGNWHKIARITGPKHNFLAVAFAHFGRNPAPKIEALGGGRSDRVSADDVLSQVQRGVAEANRELGTAFSVAAVRYVRDDTPGATIYSELAQAIVARAAADEQRNHKLAAG